MADSGVKWKKTLIFIFPNVSATDSFFYYIAKIL